MTKEEALDILHNSSVYHPQYLDAFNMAVEALEQEPPLPKIGRWIQQQGYLGPAHSYECSECGRTIYAEDDDLSDFPFCHCGAKMENANERTPINENQIFEQLVKFLAEMAYDGELEDDIDAFEEAVEISGSGRAYLYCAGSDYDRIEVFTPKYEEEGARFGAEYYDGNQAPFEVFMWKDNLEALGALLKKTSETLYQKYKESVKSEHISNMFSEDRIFSKEEK